MSLEGIESRMLGIEHQHGEHREAEPGTDPGILARQPGSAVPSDTAARDLRMGDADDLLSGVLETEAHD
jgi:hypothetical protein